MDNSPGLQIPVDEPSPQKAPRSAEGKAALAGPAEAILAPEKGNWPLFHELKLCQRRNDRDRLGKTKPAVAEVRAPPVAKIDRMRDRGDAIHPSACHALGATPRSFLEA